MERKKLDELREKLRFKKNKIGLVGTEVNVSSCKGNSMSASITTDWKKISFEYGEELNLIPDEKTKVFAEHFKIKNPEEKVGEDLIEHETGHRENPVGKKYGCPYNVDNINCRRNTDFAGQTLFWNNQGLKDPEHKDYGEFYEAFVKINLMLGSEVRSYSLLKRFFSNTPEVKKGVKGFLDDVKSNLKVNSTIALHKKREFENLFTRDMKKREELWTQLGYSFASNLADLIDSPPPQDMFGCGDGISNPFDKEMKTPQAKQKIAMKRYKENKGAAENRDPQEQLYDLYRAISKEIRVQVKSYTAAQSMPLVHYGKRFITDDDKKIKFRGIAFDSDGNLNIRTARHVIEYPVAYKTHQTNFPKLKIAMVDRSTSMEDNPDGGSSGDTSFIPWGDKSKYHYALKGYFGIENYLENQGIAPYVEACALGWSGEEAKRGNYKEVAKSLLTSPSGNTSFDIDGLEKELAKNTLVISLSDGGCNLSDDTKERLSKKLKECDFAHIQIGGTSSFADYLESQNVPVFYVNGNDDLSNVMINFVSGYYTAKKEGKK